MSIRLPRAATLLAVVLVLAALNVFTPAYGALPGPQDRTDRPATRSPAPRLIVRLNGLPLAQVPGSAPEFAVSAFRSATTGKLQVNSPAAQQYLRQLQQQQDALAATIQGVFPSARVHQTYQVVFNGLSVALPDTSDATMARLQALPGVAEVYREGYYELHTASALTNINAETLWNSPAIGGVGNAGTGVKIAVLDQGIAIDNPYFNPAGFSYPPGFPKGDVAHTTPKVIAARAYFRPDVPPLPGHETPQPGPEDSSHGTHVAGIAAGVASTTATAFGVTETISGVAPRAYLMNYKVFYANDSLFPGAFSTELITALEDAVTDGADVINNSWGGRATENPALDPVTIAADAAVDAGVTVVFSAGNEGPNKSTAGASGYSDKVISVGASTSAQTIATGFVDVVAPAGAPDTITGQPYQAAAFGPRIAGAILGPLTYVPVEVVAGSSLACDPLPAGSLAGQLVLIERGICSFSVKVFNVQQAGASTAIVYNTAEGGETLVVMAPGDQSDAVIIPAIFVARSTGVGMVDWYTQHGPAAQVQIDPRGRLIDQTPDQLVGFSSRGPTFQGSLKPDVTAPGFAILSAGFADAEGGERHLGFGLASGTSMAAPHVAGSVALLKQIYPNWTPADFKSALMSTATTEVWLDADRTEPADVLSRGAGRIDVARAAIPGLLFDRPTLSFGNVPTTPGQATMAELSVTARNISAAPQTYTLSARSTEGDFGVGVSPATLTIAAGQAATFRVAVEMPADAIAGDYGGLVELSGGPQPLHLPVWARLLPGQRGPKVLLIDNDGSSSFDFPDYAGYYGNALGELQVPFTYLDVDALAGQPQTLPDISELQKHEIILWFTGDNFVPSGAVGVPTPLTAVDQNLLIAYLQSGGNLIATGQDLTNASDIDNTPPNDPRYGRSDLYHGYLGPRFVQDDVFTNTQTLERQALGADTQPWLAGMVLDLSVPPPDVGVGDATSAGNQVSIDEIALGDIDLRVPERYVTPIFRAVSPASQMTGIIAVNTAAQPTLENPAIGLPYRTTYLAFGLEGVRNDSGATTRKELLQSILYWHVDRPGVQVSGPSTITAADQFVSFTATAQSNTPTTFVRYRWDFGDGSPILESDSATVSHRYAQPGNYQVRVEAINTWGHHAIATLQPGDNPGPASDTPDLTVQQINAPVPDHSPLTFAETGQTLEGRFQQFWQAHGGLAVFGYPITAQAQTDVTSQIFERARFELHPQNAAPYDVLLSHMGIEALQAQGRDWRTFATVDSAPEGCLYFAETGHSLCGVFKAYWERHGLSFDGKAGISFAESLALFGMPVSEPQQEVVAGEAHMVQWFERARFEHHPQNPPPYDVLLGRLGVEALR